MTKSLSTMNIPMSSPDLTPAELAAVAEVIGGSRLSLGPWLERFEKAVAEEVGVAQGIGVNSGTSGLHLCVIAAGIGEGRPCYYHTLFIRRLGELHSL